MTALRLGSRFASPSRSIWRVSAVNNGRQTVFSTPGRFPHVQSIFRRSLQSSGRHRISLPSAAGRQPSSVTAVGRRVFARSNSSRPSPDPTPHLNSPAPKLSLSQRLKQLSKEYGWTAVGVYFALSVLDFPFCFLAIRLLGTERVGRWEHAVVEAITSVVRIPFPNFGKKEAQVEGVGGPLDVEAAGSSISTGASSPKDDASIWTQLALAYAVHKSFIFIRVPLTAAVLPKVVKTLRGWGWKIGNKAA